LGRSDATSEILRDGWLYTGDLGYMDEDGYLFIVDRKKDMIKPAGFQVWPREVEEVIARHPAVAEVAVAGVRDEYQGEASRPLSYWARDKPRRSKTFAVSAGSRSPATRCRSLSSSAPRFQRARWARCCGENCGQVGASLVPLP